MWIYDRETLAFLQVNDAALRAYGFSLREFLTMTLRDILRRICPRFFDRRTIPGRSGKAQPRNGGIKAGMARSFQSLSPVGRLVFADALLNSS